MPSGKGRGQVVMHSHQVKSVSEVPKLPVIVLTGYLGAGKTTLLNYILKEQSDKKVAVIENEVGEVSVDDAIVDQQEVLAEELVVLNNGCVCCTIRGDLVKTLLDLATKREEGLVLDAVVIELTGAADPAPVVQTFMVDDSVRKSFYVDNVITLVDAKHALQKLDESEGNMSEKGTACAQIAFSSTVLLNKIDLVDSAVLDDIEKRIKQLNSTVDILRCEQAKVPVARLMNVGAFNLSKVLEEQYMDEEEFNQFYKPKMDNSISNVGVRCTGAINMFALQMFLDKYLEEEETATDFLRVKGVIDIKGKDEMFVIQCVHMLKNQSFNRSWEKGKERENRMIFIGRGMQQRRQELTEGFMACLAKPLRFDVGAKIFARTGEGPSGYQSGTVMRHWDELRAYRLKIDKDDNEVWGPVDDDAFVMSADDFRIKLKKDLEQKLGRSLDSKTQMQSKGGY